MAISTKLRLLPLCGIDISFGPFLSALLVMLSMGCGSGSSITNPSPLPAMEAPVIQVQPSSLSVPMSLAATYSVTATGDSLQYQWRRNGTAIPGATESNYTTQATTFGDSGSTFDVTVTNSAGSVTSSQASLTITARAPATGDLRFQQVDAESTVNGFGADPRDIGSGIAGRGGQSFTPSIGTPLILSFGNCIDPPKTDGYGCFWAFQQYYLPQRLAPLGLSTYYGADSYTSLQADLQDKFIVAGTGNPPNSPNSIITSLDLEPLDNLFAASWVQSPTSAGFDLSQQNVAVDRLQAAATEEGMHSRVITAVSYDTVGVTYFSYGWQRDTNTQYESKVAIVPLSAVAQAATDLAAQGYILTANGGSSYTDSFILVGTRVMGDTVPRPFLAVEYTGHGETFIKQEHLGYAIVGALQDSKGGMTYLTER